MSLIGILIALIIIGVVFWAATKLIAAFQIPEPIGTVIIVLLVVVCLVFLVSQFTDVLGFKMRLL